MASAAEYIERRIRPRRMWYSRRAAQNKAAFLTTQFLGVIGSVSVVLLLHFEEVERPVIAIVAAIVAILIGIERVGQFGNLWQSYRMAVEWLDAETNLYANQAGPYARSGPEAERRLVERTEAMLAHEAEHWISILQSARGAATEPPA